MTNQPALECNDNALAQVAIDLSVIAHLMDEHVGKKVVWAILERRHAQEMASLVLLDAVMPANLRSDIMNVALRYVLTELERQESRR